MQYKASHNPFFYKTGIALPLLMTCFLHLAFSSTAYTQENSSYIYARTKLVSTLKKRFVDKAYSESIDRFYFTSCDSLIKKDIIIDNRPIRVILTRLFDACENKINSRLITLLRIPSVNSYFLLTIKNYKKQPINKLYREIGITQSSILESAFDGITLGDSITTFVGIREMLNTPYYISTRLYQSRYAPYKDTLLYYLANAAPDILIKKLADHDSLFTALVKKSNNITVRAVSQISKDMYYDKVLPFSLAILENRITAEEIKKLTSVPQDYYRAFINEVTGLRTSAESERRLFLEQPIADLNKTLANQYYISEINMLHESPDKLRFQVLNTCKARELYFLLTGGSGELYTSSFLYLYKKFIEETGNEGLEKFFTDIDYYQFDQFISNLSGYGLVDNLVHHLGEENMARLLGKYLTSLSSKQLTDNEIILNAMTMSDVLYSISHHLIVRDILLSQLANLENVNPSNDVLLERMYHGFRGILLDKNEFKRDSIYDVLTIKRLQKNNNIVQVCFFYDDEDGCNSFNKSVAIYDPVNWDKNDMGNYIFFHARSGNKMRVYMNKPMTIPGCDSSQDEMLRSIERDGYEATSFIHRGHSYHLYQSLKKITTSAQFVFLGSCGGYNEVLKIFQLNPDVNIIATRNIGSVLVNDPLLYIINMDIVNNKDIVWDDVWQELNARFQSKLTRDLFSSYIPPNKYIAVKFIQKVFNF